MAILDRSQKVLLLHGWGGSFESTFKASGLVDQLKADGFTVLEVNLPGHGSSGGSWNPQDYADLASLVEHQLPKEPLLALGFSLGAKVLLELCIRLPDQFKKVVIAGLGDNAFTSEKLGTQVADALEHGTDANTHPGIIGLVEYSKASLSDPLALAAVLRRSPNPLLTKDRLRSVVCPVCVINGWEDGVARPEHELITAMPNAELTIIPDLDHFNLTASKIFIDTAASFFAKAP